MEFAPLHRPFDANLSVEDALDAYLAENAFTKEEYDKTTVTVNFWGMRFTLPNPPSRQLAVRFHDLHHVITGYGTDPAGEFEISAWEMRRGVGVFGLYVRLIIASGWLSGLVLFPRRSWAAWRHGGSKPRLPPPSLELYQELLMLDVRSLRARYGVDEGGIAGARGLHQDAPKEHLARVGASPKKDAATAA